MLFQKQRNHKSVRKLIAFPLRCTHKFNYLLVRAHQKDFFHFVALREQVDNVLRSWLGRSFGVVNLNHSIDMLRLKVPDGYFVGLLK